MDSTSLRSDNDAVECILNKIWNSGNAEELGKVSYEDITNLTPE